MAAKPKALMICPFCDDGRAFSWQGVSLHVKAKHPSKLQELKDNKAMYLEKFACDEAGNPLAGVPSEPEPAPAAPTEPRTPPEKKVPEPKPPAPEVTPPEKKEKPAEGGLFHRISTSIFG